jgi:hypothetical protein
MNKHNAIEIAIIAVFNIKPPLNHIISSFSSFLLFFELLCCIFTFFIFSTKCLQYGLYDHHNFQHYHCI